MYRMQQLRFDFWAIPTLYLMHLDLDDQADAELHTARGKSDPSYKREAKGTMNHHGRAMCDMWDDPKHGDLSWVPPAQETTLIGWMRFSQTYVSHVSFFGDNDKDRDADPANDTCDVQKGGLEFENEEEWEAHTGPTDSRI